MALIDHHEGQRGNNMVIQNPEALPPPLTAKGGIDLLGYLHQHQGDIFALVTIATLVTMSHWRNWFYPENLTRVDGTADPRAGRFNMNKAVADFFTVPSLVVLGLLFIGFRPDFAMAGAVVAVAAFVGSAFIFTTFEKARDGALGVFMQFLANWVPGGKK